MSEPTYSLDRIAVFHGGKVDAQAQRLYTVLALNDDNQGEEFDIVAPHYATRESVKEFVEGVLKKDYVPGMYVAEVDDFHGAYVY